MADYTDIYGKRVKDFDSDPTLTSSYEGQVWYDKSTGVLKSVPYYITGNTNICIIHRAISDFQHIFDIQLLV